MRERVASASDSHLEEDNNMRKWPLPLMAVLLLAGCGSDDDPSDPSPVVPSPTPTAQPSPSPSPGASSAYAGNWSYRTTILAVDSNCGHTQGDIGRDEGPFAVAVGNDGTFTLPGGGTGSIDSGGTVSFTLAAGSNNCTAAGTGLGGCRDNDHCDGTSTQDGDVKRWRMQRQ
jgi:hypothetical protein